MAPVDSNGMVVGLTGGVASGKSLVCGELKRLGARVIDADVVSREVMAPGAAAYDGIIKEFGAAVLNHDGTIDRKALGKIVFSDPSRLARLNALTHPAIRERIRSGIKALQAAREGRLIVVDAALLIETGLYREMSRVIVVCADEQRQLERLMKRDGLSEQDALCRLKAQMPLKEKTAYADYVIDNNGDMETTKKRVARLYEQLTKDP